MKHLIILLTVFSFFSCANKPNVDKAVKAVLDSYGGTCKYEMEKTINLNETINFYTLTISDSEYLKQFDDLSIPASNIALIFYSNLSNSSNVDQIRVNILLDKKSIKKIFYSNDIKLFQHKKKIFNKLNQFIVKKQYDELYNNFADVVKKQLKKTDMIDAFEIQKTEYGDISDVIIQGFGFNGVTINDKIIPLITFKGTVKRSSRNTRISILIDKTDKLYSIEFDW